MDNGVAKIVKCVSRSLRVAVIGSLAAMALATAFAQQAPSLTYRRGETVAVVQVGVTESGTPVLRRVEYGVVSPAIVEGNDDPIAVCLKKADVIARPARMGKLTPWGTELREGMSKILERTAMPMVYADAEALEQNEDYAKAYRSTRASVELHLNATAVAELSDLLGHLDRKLGRELEKAGCLKTKGKVYFTLTQRVCAGVGDCAEYRGADSPSLTYLRGNKLADRFDLLMRWAYAYRADEGSKEKAEYAKGLLLPNQHVLVSEQGAGPPLEGTLILDAYRGESAPASEKAIQEYMERLVQGVRSSRSPEISPDASKKIPAQVLRMLNVSQQIYVRLADAFAYAEGLPTTLPSKVDASLLSISDKMAEARLAECVLNKRVPILAANGQPNLEAIKTCTGYNFPDMKSLAACLPQVKSGLGLCRPTLAVVVDGPMLRDTVVRMQIGTYVQDAKDLATASLVGRLSNLKYSDVAEKYAKACTNTDTEAAMAECFFKQHFSEIDYKNLQKVRDCAKTGAGEKTIECLANAGFAHGGNSNRLSAVVDCTSGNSATLADCIAAGVMDDETQRKIACIRLNSEPILRAQCIGKELPGMDMARYEACINGGVDSRLTCLAALPGMPRVAQTADACKDARTLQGSTVCARALGINIPAGVETAISCASRASTAEAIACMADGRISGDGGKVLSCATQSNFDAAGTGACVVGTILKFNEDLMMAATCVASTGGEPISAGSCTFGKLAMREFGFCRDSKFGEGKCFGKNNTLVKLLGIGPNSTAGQLVNVQLEMYKGMIAFAENPGKTTGEFVRNAGRELTVVRDNVVREAGQFHDNLRREASKVFGKGVHIKVSCCKVKI